MTLASPRCTMRKASPTACAPVAQAVDTAWLGPFRPYLQRREGQARGWRQEAPRRCQAVRLRARQVIELHNGLEHATLTLPTHVPWVLCAHPHSSCVPLFTLPYSPLHHPITRRCHLMRAGLLASPDAHSTRRHVDKDARHEQRRQPPQLTLGLHSTPLGKVNPSTSKSVSD